MAIFHCDTCNVTKLVPDKFIGRTVSCPKCMRSVAIGAGEEVPPVENEAEEVATTTPAEAESSALQTSEAAQRGIALSLSGGDEEVSGSVSLFQGSLVKNICSGLVSGIVAVVFSLALASLVFSRSELSQYLPHAMSMTLLAMVVVGLFTAFLSRVPFALAGPEPSLCVLLYLMAMAVQAKMTGAYPAVTVFPTLVASIALTTFGAGVCIYYCGKIGAGAWVRFIPFQIMGGILAGIGLFLLQGAHVFVQAHGPCLNEAAKTLGFDLSHIAGLANWDPCLRWLPALLLGVVLFLVLRWIKNPLALLVVLALAVGGAHGAFVFLGVPLSAAASHGWLLTPFEQVRFWEVYSLPFFQNIQWTVVKAQIPYMAAMALLIAVTQMRKITQLELLLEREIDLDRELRTAGVANAFAGLGGAMPGGISLTRTLYARRLGADGPVAGIMAALVCCVALLFHHLAVPFIPTFVLAGMLVYFGLDLLVHWLVDVRSEFTRVDEYGQLVGVFLVTVFLGVLLGASVAVATALLVLVSRYARIDVVKHSLSGATNRSNVDRAAHQLEILKEKGGRIYIMRLQGFIFLGTTSSLMHKISARIRAMDQIPVQFVILDFTLVNGLDSSVAISFVRLKQMARENSVNLVFTNVPFEVEQGLEQGGYKLNDPDGSSRTFLDLDFAMEWCENEILAAENALESQQMSLPQLLEPIFPEPAYIPHLMKCLQRVEVQKGQAVFRQGDPSDSMYFLESGMVSIQLELERNKILRLKKLAPGTVFGEMGLYTTAPRSASVVASEDCILYRLSAKTLSALQSKAPVLVSAVHRFIVNLLAQRVANTNAMVRDLQR